MVFQAPKGVPDYYPPRSRLFRLVQDALSAPARTAGYDYVELPIFEDTALFVRGVGESTDVVSKEMYTFEDRGGRSITLRPEGTAGVMRVVVEHGLDRGQLPVKLWYQGPFFRAERPQHGRYRQLQQVGVEAIGSDDPALDAEVIALAAAGYASLGLRHVELHLTSLGCAACRPAYRERLVSFLGTCDLDEGTRQRSALNPMRVLDDKRPEVQQQLESAPVMVDHLCASCQAHYDQVRAYLRVLGVPWQENPRMVRGLDYYTRTTFEFVHPMLGAQSGIGGGGRYDGLMETIGGASLSGIGYGLGVDRTVLAVEAEGLDLGSLTVVDVIGVPIGSVAKEAMIALIHELRGRGIRADMVFGERGLKGAMKSAARSGAPIAVIMGDDECADDVVQVKDMATGEQSPVARDAVVAMLVARVPHGRITP